MRLFEIGTSGIWQLATRVTLLLALAFVIDLGLRRWTSAAVRHLVWTAAVFGALLMPIIQLTIPDIGITTRTELIEDKPAPAVVQYVPSTVPASSEAGVIEAPPSAPARPAFGELLIGLYLLGVGIVIGRVLLDHHAVRRLLARCEPLEDGPWAAALRSLNRRVRILRTMEDLPPLTVGLARAAIIVPPAESWTADRREAVLMHELAHVERRDCLTQLVAAIACALYWPHPLIWVAAARMRIERELACDDRVLSQGVSGHRYATHLLEIARSLVTTRIPVVAVSMAAPSNLEGRLRAVISDGRSRFAPGRRTVAFAAGAALAVFVPLSNVTGTTRVVHIAAPIWRLLGTASAPTPAPSATRASRATGRSAATTQVVREPGKSGEFTVALTTRRTTQGGAVIHLALMHPDLTAISYPLARFDGLTEDQLTRSAGPLSFHLRGDAGTFDFVGAMNGTEGTGRFEFRADSSFRARLADRGITIREDDQFALTLAPAVNAAGGPFVGGGIGGGRVRVMSLDDFLAMRMAAGGGSRALPVPMIPGDRARPSPAPTPTTLDGTWTASPAIRINGAMRLEINWSDNNQWVRAIDPADLHPTQDGFTFDAPAGKFTFTGSISNGFGEGRFVFTPNTGFIATLGDLGIREPIVTHDLKNLGFYGIDASRIRELRALGVGPLTKDQLMGIAIFDVTPDFVRRLKDSGERDLSPENLVAIRRGGRRWP